MAIKSQFNLPKEEGGYEVHHFETEVAQLADATAFSQTILQNGTNAESVRELLNINYFRKANTAYALGDIVYSNALTIGKKLVCVKAGTSDTTDLTFTSTDEGAIVTDGTVVWEIDTLANGLYTASFANSCIRGVDLTAYWESGLMSTNIQAGVFVGMHVGDYIKKSITANGATYSNVTWLLTGFDVQLHHGDTETTAHHVCIMPDVTLQRNVYMNSSNTTSGGYVGSYMWKTVIPQWSTGMTNAWGSSHILVHRELLTNGVNSNTINNWAWYDVTVNIPNEAMIYGSAWSSYANNGGYNAASTPVQLPLFALRGTFMTDNSDRSWYWLRDVVSSSDFATADYNGIAYDFGASHCDLERRPSPVFPATVT